MQKGGQMKDYNKMIGIIVAAIIFTIMINIITLFIINNSINKIKTKYFNEIFLEYEKKEIQGKTNEIEKKNSDEKTASDEEKINEHVTNEDIENNSSFTKEVKNNMTNIFNDDETIGTINIPKIKFEGKIYEGTSLDVLAKGVGHFDNSPYLDGNVCLAAHNTSKFWAKLKTLKKGDSITYESFLGTREYKVSEITQIEETDWTKLENTEENMLTLITCVKGNKPKRLCVRAVEN